MRNLNWDEPYGFSFCADVVVLRCIPELEITNILEACHSSQVWGHHSSTRTTYIQCRFYRPKNYMDAYNFSYAYDQCQRQENSSRLHGLLMTPILELELFYIWVIDFMCKFVSSYSWRIFFVDVDYVLKWVEVVPLPNNKGRRVILFLKTNIFHDFSLHMQLLVIMGLTFSTIFLRPSW